MTVGILTDPSMVVATSSGGTRETLFTQLNTVASGNAANALESSLASNRGVDSRLFADGQKSIEVLAAVQRAPKH
jgi:hypothetical protein